MSLSSSGKTDSAHEDLSSMKEQARISGVQRCNHRGSLAMVAIGKKEIWELEVAVDFKSGGFDLRQLESI